MQIDIGFSDVITPGAVEIEYPTLLRFPAPVLQAYPRETVIAEKLGSIDRSWNSEQPNEEPFRFVGTLPHLTL
jgi:Nucleotidyl transferase AbiEii toxin, Type IV TA system